MLVECLTDNRHRTAGDVRATFSKGGGTLAAEGAVAWNFQRKGSILVKPGPSEDRVMEAALDAGADDVVGQGADGFEVRTDPGLLHQVSGALERSGLPLGEQRWIYLPQNTVKVDGEAARKVVKLLELLEDNDDVQNVWANADIPERELEQMGA